MDNSSSEGSIFPTYWDCADNTSDQISGLEVVSPFSFFEDNPLGTRSPCMHSSKHYIMPGSLLAQRQLSLGLHHSSS